MTGLPPDGFSVRVDVFWVVGFRVDAESYCTPCFASTARILAQAAMYGDKIALCIFISKYSSWITDYNRIGINIADYHGTCSNC